jgi:LacI family transcriptional regulator
MSVTVLDVARAAGVSASTVSRVLNGTAPVHAAKRRRVLQAVRRLGYEPNGLARSLKQRKSLTLGLVVPDITNPFFAEIAKGVETASHRLGYSLILCNSGNAVERERRYLEVLRERRVDGLVFVPAGRRGDALRAWTARGLPVVLMDRVVDGVTGDVVVTDNAFGMKLLVRHLVRLGHRTIGLIGGPRGVSSADERWAGFLEGLRDAGLTPDPRLMMRGDFTFETGLRAAPLLSAAARGRLTAIVASSDVMALGAMRAVHQRGGRVPETVSIAGFDDIAAASLAQPPLTTVAQPVREIGERAVELLVGRVVGERTRPSVVRLKPRLVVRQSTGPTPAGGAHG